MQCVGAAVPHSVQKLDLPEIPSTVKLIEAPCATSVIILQLNPMLKTCSTNMAIKLKKKKIENDQIICLFGKESTILDGKPEMESRRVLQYIHGHSAQSETKPLRKH